jgi:hypothetical protein
MSGAGYENAKKYWDCCEKHITDRPCTPQCKELFDAWKECVTHPPAGWGGPMQQACHDALVKYWECCHPEPPPPRYPPIDLCYNENCSKAACITCCDECMDDAVLGCAAGCLILAETIAGYWACFGICSGSAWIGQAACHKICKLCPHP